MSKIVIGVVLAVLIIVAGVVVYWFYRPGGETTLATVKIGIVTPLSPPGAYTYGQQVKRGCELARDYINDNGGVLGGRMIELVIGDSSGTVEKGVAAANRLIDEGCIALTGFVHSSVCRAVQDVCEDRGVICWSTAASAAILTTKHLHTMFRCHPIDTDRARMWLRWINAMDFKRVAVLAQNTDYGLGLNNDTNTYKSELAPGATFNSWTFDLTGTDFTSTLLLVKEWNPDLVILIGSGPSIYLMIDQSYSIDLYPKVPFLNSDPEPTFGTWWSNLGAKGNYISFMNYFVNSMPLTTTGQDCKEAYYITYGQTPVYGTFSGYTSIKILAAAIVDAGSSDPENVITALLSHTYEAWYGNVTFTEGEGVYWHQASPPLLIIQYNTVNQALDAAPIVFPPEMKTGNWTAAPQ